MKFFTLIFAVMMTVTAFSQNATFNNNGGDNLWSNPDNWSDGELPTGTAWLKQDVIVDMDQTVERVELAKTHDADVTISGDAMLTVTGGNGNNGNIIRNQSETGIKMMFAGNVTVNNTGGSSNLSTADFSGNVIEFLEGSTVTVMTQIKLKNFGKTGVTIFNGKIEGEGKLTCITNNSNVVFGPTADNSNFVGNLTVFNTTVVSNTTVVDGFIGSDMAFTISTDGGVVEINGENSLGGRLNKGGTGEFTLDINANQNSVGVLRVGLNTLNIDIDPAVTELYFAPSNNSDWDTMTAQVNIVGFRNGVIRFGESDTTLTAFQLEKINIGGATPMLDQNGFLVDEITTNNSFPTVSDPIADIMEDQGFGSGTVDLAGRFSDMDGDALTYSAASSDPAVATISISGDELTYTEVGIGTAIITVTADDGNGGTVSDEFTLTIDQVNSANELIEIEGLTVFPNPTFDGKLMVSCNQLIQDGLVRVFDTRGSVLYEKDIEMASKFELNLPNLASGVLIVKIEDLTKGQVSIIRILKK